MRYYDRIRQMYINTAGSYGGDARAERARRIENITYEDVLQDRMVFGTPESVAVRLGELRDLLGLTGVIEVFFQDNRTGTNGLHGMVGQFCQSVFGRLGGYDDVNDAGRREKVELKLPPGIRYLPCPDQSLSGMLADGTIDAVLSARPPRVFLERPDLVARLFPDYRPLEQAYWQKTGVFPIMHVIAIRREVYEARRWIAANLMAGFEAAKARSIARVADITASAMPLPWVADYAAQSREVMGEDIWPYGVEGNRATLAAFCNWAWEQGVCGRHMAPEDLFVPESLARAKV